MSLDLRSRLLPSPWALLLAACVYALGMLAILELEEYYSDGLAILLLAPSVALGVLAASVWGGTVAVFALAGFALVHEPVPPVDVVAPAYLVGAAAGLVGRFAAGRLRPAAVQQAGTGTVRAQQSGALADLLSRLVSRRAVDDVLDRLRLRLDTFPRGIYQPVSVLPVRAAKRAAGSESRWQAIEPVVERLGVRSAVDIGANAGYFTLALGRHGIPTLAVDPDPGLHRTALLAVRRSRLDNVGVLSLEVRPDTVAVLPRADATLMLSVWHHLVRHDGLDAATDLLAAIWERTATVMFFDTGEDEMPPEFGLPDMGGDPRAWLGRYLEATCAGSRAEHLGRHAAFDAAGSPCERNLFAVVRTDAPS